MKNIFILILTFFLLGGTNQSFSNWYGNFSQSYIGSSTWCNEDGDTTGGLPASFTNSPLPGSYTHDSRGIPGSISGGNFSCERWDAQDPVASANGDSTTIWRISPAFTFNIFASDQGGSGVATRKYRWDNPSCFGAGGSAYNNGDTMSIVSQGIHQLYVCVTDVAGNTDTWNGTYMWDYNDPTGAISYTDGWIDNDFQTVNYTVDPDPESGIASYQLQVRSSSNNPSFATGWSTWSNVGGESGTTAGSYTYNYTGSNHTAYEYRLLISDIATNSTIVTSTNRTKIDIIEPVSIDVITVSIPNNENLLADYYSIDTTVGINGGSPIVLIEGIFEDLANENNYPPITFTKTDIPFISSTVNFLADMTNVDLYRHSDGYREYTFKITKIRDEAGNEITDILGGTLLPQITYDVYANSSTISDSDGASLAKNDVTTNQLDLNHIADGENKLLRLELEDRYGNQIVPTSNIGSINREIDFRFYVTNNLALDQYSGSGNAVFLDRPSTPGIFSNLLNTTTTLSDESSSNGIYDYDFQVYTPTYLTGSTDGRQWANGDMTIHDIDYIIRQNSSTYITGTNSGSIDFDGGKTDILFAFKPLYLAKFTGDLNLGIFVDTVQSAVVTINRAVGSPAVASNDSVWLGFGQTNGADDNVPHPNYELVYWPTALSTGIPMGHQADVSDLQDLLGNLSVSPKNFDVKISHVTGTVDPSLATYVSSHIRYTLNGHQVTYDGNTIGKIRYVDGTNLINTNQIGLKVLGRIQSKTQEDITNGQSGTDLYAVGNNSKAGLKELIRKQTILETKNIDGIPSGITNVTNLTGNTWSNPSGTRLRHDTILYYDLTSSLNKIVEIGSAGDLVAGGVKTIIIKGGNAYMKGNITYSNKSTDMLGVVVLSDDLGIGGNIYLDPSVTHLVGIYYADKALMSYTTADGEIDGSVGTSILSDQFYLYGTLFSENSIGGTILLKCPYYVTVICDINEAKKYDLNFIRRYFTYIADGDGIKDDIYNSGNSYYSYGNDNFDYPVVIEYNPNIQNTPPPLFESKHR